VWRVTGGRTVAGLTLFLLHEFWYTVLYLFGDSEVNVNLRGVMMKIMTTLNPSLERREGENKNNHPQSLLGKGGEEKERITISTEWWKNQCVSADFSLSRRLVRAVG
jgi:hypothetical protein